MGVFLYLLVSIIAFVVIMLVCKWSNFSIIPEDLKLKTPKKYKFPKISRGEDYKWEAHYSSSEESSDDDDDILFDYPSEEESDSDSEEESDDSDSS